jgi:hypothetical protein
MRYLLLLYSEESEAEPTPDERQATLAAFDAFTEDVQARGAFLGANPLESVQTATSVRVRSGDTLITDGPFAETREHLCGYYLVECPDLEEALAIASRCPLAATGTVEVRPIMELPGLHRDDATEERPAA